MEKVISCGIILTDGEKFLAVSPRKRPKEHQWDVPKGHQEEGESYATAALREFKEETGLDLSQYRSKMEGLSQCPLAYIPGKDLFLFKLEIAELPPIETHKCESFYFNGKFRKELPEVNKFAYVPLNDIKKYLFVSYSNYLDSCEFWVDSRCERTGTDRHKG